MTTDDALKLLQQLVDAEWQRWEISHGDPAPRSYDLALSTIREELARGGGSTAQRIAEAEASVVDIGKRTFRV